MDTKKDSAASDVPTFKVARVGNDRKRKGAGFSFLRSGGSRGGFSGATGGSGSGGGLGGLLGGAGGGAGAQAGFFASKFVQAMLSVMLAGGIGSAAIYIGAMSTQTDEPAKKAAPFVAKEDVKLEGDITNLPGDPNAIPNSLGYLSGSMDGLTPEERAKRAAEEAARKAAEEEAARKAEEEAARTAANPAVDPNALLASAQADGQNKGGGLGRKFGNLSSSFGGGSSLAGGAGMAGGVGRSFGAGGGSIKGGARGSLSKASTTAKPSFSRASNARGAGSNVKGFARRQLANANSLSRRGATASKGETASYDAGSAFDNNQGAGNVISGPGIGAGGGPNSGGADGSVNPGSPSGPTGNPPVTDCGANNYQTADGGCAPIPTKNMKKDTKWDWLYQTASALMMALTLLAGIALMSNALNALFATGEAIKAAVRVAMGIIGGILMALGAMMIAMTGDKIAGGIVAAVGTWTLAMAIWTPELTTGSAMKEVALKIFVPTIVGGFASAMAKKPAAAGQ